MMVSTHFKRVADEAARLAQLAGFPEAEVAHVKSQLRAGLRPDLPTYRSTIRRVDSGLALRAVGRREAVHPRDVLAFTHPSHASADFGAYMDTEWYGHEVLARQMVDDGILVVIDLRPALHLHGCPVTDPVRRDDWRPGD